MRATLDARSAWWQPRRAMQLSARTDDVAPFLAMDVMERGMAMTRGGVDVVQMGVGEPDFDAPPEVVEATMEALRRGHTHYTDSRGIAALREAIAADCVARRGVQVHADQVLVTSGSSPAILLCLEALLDPGDEVIVATPHYPCYPNMIAVCGGKTVFVPTHPEDGYVIDPDAVKKAVGPRTKAILLGSPANPTGAVQPKEVVEAICALGIPILSDEIYDGLVYDGAEVTSPLGRAEACFVLDGFSKRYAMTGFRLGYAIVPADAARSLRCLQQNLFISTADFVQHAGIAALQKGAPHVARMRDTYAARRGALVDGLRAAGFEVPKAPPGAFYVLADARRFGDDSLALAFRILERAHVACGPGRDFGTIAEGFLRFSFATSEDRIAEGIRRLTDALPGLSSAT